MLKRWWCRLIGTRCKWEILAVAENRYESPTRLKLGNVVYQRCTICGQLKAWET